MARQIHIPGGKEKPKKAKGGISVGPGNLPDGTHLRKGIWCKHRVNLSKSKASSKDSAWLDPKSKS